MAVQINVAANQAALVASIQAGVQAYNQRFANNNQINLSINARAFSQPLGRITGDVKDFEAALAASNARVIAFGASTAVLGGVIRSFKELATVTIEVEKNLADINRVFGLTTSQLQKFSTDLFNVTKQTASTFDEASKAALEFSRQGLKAEDTLQRTKDALTLTRLAGISTANAVDALTSTVNGFAATGVTTSQILNKLVAVEQDFAVGAGDLAEALSRTGQAAQEAGVSLDQLNALVTSAQQSTARGGAVIGNALKTIFTRLQRTETLDQLEAFNISVRDVQGNILPAVTILQNFAGAYKNLADAQRAQLSEQVAGVYQVNILKAIVNDLNQSQGVYAGALQRGASATNEAEIATAKLNKTLDALLSQTATSAQQLANNIGKVTFEPLARYGTEQLKSLVESMNEILEGEGIGSTFANGLLKGIRNVIAGPGAIAAFFTLFKLIQNSFSFLTQALPQIAGITTETQNRKNIEQSILQIMQQQGPISQALAGTMGNQAAQAQLLLQLARQQTAEYQQQTALAKQLATQLSGQGVRVKGSAGLQVTRAGGYVPAATKLAEVVGAKAGGYSPGRVVPSPVGGVMNTAEDVKYIPGFAQPFINPPANSKAGRAHRQNAISRTGVDPYMFSGFIPNFASKKPSQFDIGRDFENTVGLDIGVLPAYNAAIDFNKVITKPLDKNYNPRLYKPNSFADAHAGYGHKSSENISKVINHLNENYYSYFPKEGLKTKRLKIDDKSSLISKVDSLGDLFIRPYYTEIIGQGFDEAAKTQTSTISSLNTTAKATLLNGLSDRDKKSVLNKKIKMLFAQDRVYGNGFIPNFAPPASAIRVPWFKKFANPAYDNIQPTLGISKASDFDTFRQVNFRSNAKGADKVGDSNIFAPLYEDFVFKALQLASQPKIKDQLIRGYVLQPGSDQKQSAFDAFLGDVAFEKKGFPKENLTGSISKNLNDKYERFVKANPSQAAKIKESIIVFNEVGHENQITSQFGKSFSELAGTSYSQMLKNSPDLVKGLSLETNMLLDKYVRNPQFLKINAAKGFIPNFAYKQAVMGLEESMSGNKAIFDTKPFPHVRNSSQPTFSSAIADHGSLGNALSDSMRGQKAAGLMSKGFIPNFANSRSARRRIQRNQNANNQTGSNPSQMQSSAEKFAQDALTQINNAYQYIAVFGAAFADAIENASKASVNKIKSASSTVQSSIGSLSKNLTSSISNISNSGNRFAKFSENLSKASTAISIAGPMLAGFAEQAVFADRKRIEMTAGERAGQSFLSTGLSSISTGAGIGAAFGPLGAGIGAAAGGLVALTSALNSTVLTVEELADLNQEKISKDKESIQAGSNYINNQNKLNDLIKKGASSNEVEKASLELTESFKEIKNAKLAQIFVETGGSVEKMADELNKFTQEVSRRESATAALSNLRQGAGSVAQFFGFTNTTAQKGVKNPSEVAAQLLKASELFADIDLINLMKSGSFEKTNEKIKKTTQLVKQIFPDVDEMSDEFKDLNKAFNDLLFGSSGFFIAKSLQSMNLNKNVAIEISKFKEVATRSFSQIFRDIEKSLTTQLFEISLAFEKDSGNRKIQQTILDFSINFQDNINSLLQNNLPDFRKFDFTAASASQKAQLQLQKSQQDYDKAIADQANERSNFLIKNSQEISKAFQSSLSTSQVNAQFYQEKVLPQIQSGNYTGDINSIISGLQQSQLNKVSETRKAATFLGADGFGYGNAAEIETTLKSLSDVLKNQGLSQQQRDEIIAFQQELINLQETNLKFSNGLEKEKLQLLMSEKNENQILFNIKQENAKKELQINKQLNEARIAVEKDIAIEKAEVDKANLARMESMKNLSATIGNNLEIAKARSSAQVAGIQRRLNDPRETYGMGTAQITERRINLQNEILKEQRSAEDQAVNAEIQQRMLEMAAEQENTAATLKLNDTIMALIETQLRGALGGADEYEIMRQKQIQNVDLVNEYGSEKFAQFQALQRIQESRLASAANNPVYNSQTFENAMATAGFNKVDDKGKSLMSQQEQRQFLTEQQRKAEEAGNVVLANTIKRYREQIDAKQKVLNITREQIDADIRLQSATERQLTTIRGRLAKGFGELNDEGDKLVLNLGENLPKMFADGMVNGIKAAIRESDNLGDALMGVAASFLDSISTTLMQAGTYKILGSLGFENLLMKQAGGLIRAQSGMYVSGTGTGDKYPALLENGEYVLNRRAVMAMGGPAALDTLNFSMAPRFASGGSFNAELSDIKAMEEGMTTFGLENSPYYKELRDAEIQRAEEARQKKRARQAQTAQMVGSLVASVATVAVGAGLQNVASNMQAKAAEKMVQSGTGAIASAGLSTYGDTPQLYAETGLSKAEVRNFQRYVNSGYINPSGMSMAKTPRVGFRSILPPSAKTPSGRQTGGLIGSRLSDTIPGYMEGGLYNSPMVKKYGTGMQAGGMSPVANNNSNTVNNNNANNAFNFNTTVNRDGTIQMGANSTSYKQQDVELSNNLNNRIYGAVLDVIRDQQRFGGSLAGTRKA